jgi:Heavy metal binding domain
MGCRLTGMRITRATLLCAGLLSGCVASDLPAPSQRSPASLHAAEAAPRRVASSLESDPLNELGKGKGEGESEPGVTPVPSPTQHEHHHHHHSQAAPQHPSSDVLGRGRANSSPLAADGGIAGPPVDGGTPAPRLKTEYVCPMHPEIRQPASGRCPKCGMQLVPKSTPDGPRAQPTSAAAQGHSSLRVVRDPAVHSATSATVRSTSTALDVASAPVRARSALHNAPSSTRAWVTDAVASSDRAH